jgi:hypothetical protein
VSKGDIYIRGWGAVTTLGWSASESAKNLIAGKVAPAKAGSASHLISREFKSFEVPYAGNPLDKSKKMLDSALAEAISRAGLSAVEIAESSLLVGTTGGFLFATNMNLPKPCAKIRGRNRRQFPVVIEDQVK